MSGLEDALVLQLWALGLPNPVREYRFCPPRRWRFDLCWPDRMLAAEVEGGVWTGGAHVRGRVYRANCAKYNEAVLLGWRVLRFTTDDIKDGTAFTMIERAFAKG